MGVPHCTISYSSKEIQAITASLLTGLIRAARSGLIKIDKIIPCNDFRKAGYLHNAIIELQIGDKKFAYDTADGYQSIHKKEMFDLCLDNVDSYYMISYNPLFQAGMRNEHKVKSLGLTLTGILCKGNPFLMPSLKRDSALGFLSKIKRFNENLQNGSVESYLCNNSYDYYKFLFWTRLWENNRSDSEYNKSYPYLSTAEAHYYNSLVHEMIDSCNQFRIDTVRLMKEQFGPRFVYGIYVNETAKQLCPDLLQPCPELDSKPIYKQSLKQNYICINTEGLYHCYGAKVTEYLASGRAVISQEFHYQLPVPLIRDTNYIGCKTAEEIVSSACTIADDLSQIKAMEEANYNYFLDNCLPEHIIRQSIENAVFE